MHIVIQLKQADMIGTLVGFGGELDMQDIDGNTPLVFVLFIFFMKLDDSD